MLEIYLSHTIAAGHRIVGHEDGKGKCARLHGHTYRFEITLQTPHLVNGMVMDFGVIKKALDTWDHRLILWDEDPFFQEFGPGGWGGHGGIIPDVLDAYGIIHVPFNPTAEAMALWWADEFYTKLLIHHGLDAWYTNPRKEFSVKVEVWESDKSAAKAVRT